MFLNAWLLGTYGYIVAAAALLLTALTLSQSKGPIIGIMAVLGALICWFIMFLLVMSGVLLFGHALLAEFAISAFVFLYLLLPARSRLSAR